MVSENIKSHNKQDIQGIPKEMIPARRRKSVLGRSIKLLMLLRIRKNCVSCQSLDLWL
jgi:hypothetical protein